jgi:hypothetical protein
MDSEGRESERRAREQQEGRNSRRDTAYFPAAVRAHARQARAACATGKEQQRKIQYSVI